MKDNCRIIVGLDCNYRCEYCCNKLSGMLDKFERIYTKPHLHKIISEHKNIVISGGEPLFQPNREKTHYVALKAAELGKRIYIYTNLEYFPTLYLIDKVDGWTIGFHPTQCTAEFFDRVIRLKQLGARGIRVNAEDKCSHMLKDIEGLVEVKLYERDKCDKTDVEDWYKLSF